MKATIQGGPSFSYLEVYLGPGESITSEAGAMSTMSADLDMKAKFNGGLFRGLTRKYLGSESLFINTFSNNTNKETHLTLVQDTPGEIRSIELQGNSFCLQPGAYLASTPGLSLGVRYAGISSFIGREGLFKLEVSGHGTLFYGAYGGLIEKEVDGEYIVDTSHLVAYEPGLKLKMQLAGGIFASFFGGEGLVTRIEGKGKIILQSRSISGLASWINPKFWA